MNKKIKLIISDCHLSGGLYFQGERNPHEDFYFDEEMIAFFEYFSSGEYGDGCEVEFILNGDFLDFLNIVNKNGDFEETVTEEHALYKVDCILKGHPKVFETIRKVAARPGKSFLYNIGNHDADLFFPKVRERLIRAWDPDGKFPSEKIKIEHERPFLDLEGGIQMHHGNQFEAVHFLNFDKPLIAQHNGSSILNFPWGSFYVLKIVNRFKMERDYVDKVRPVKAMMLWGLFFDTWFVLKFAFFSLFYFMKTRFIYSSKRRSQLSVTIEILKQESTTFLQDLEASARQILNNAPDVHTVIMGHTHHPMHKVYQDGKAYINTGTWTKMINLDIRTIGNNYQLTFAKIDYRNSEKPEVTLNQWMGDHKPYSLFRR